MKLIIAIIQPHHIESVKTALSQVEVFRLTIMDCQGFGRQQGQVPAYGSEIPSDEFAGNLRRKIQLQIAVNEEFVEPTVQAIIAGGRTGDEGEIGDGKIFVLPLDDCVRIRTGERGVDAI
ncbi:MAG: P-II family nitrogen regulator [Mariniblastus sp.]